MKLRYKLISLVTIFVMNFVHAEENVKVSIQLPEGISVNYADLKVNMFTKNGRKLGNSIRVNSDLTFAYPAAYSVGMLQVRKKSHNTNRSSVMFLVTEVSSQQKKVEINALTLLGQ